MGDSSSEISRLGNFILGRAAFDSEAPPPSVEQHSERARGTVEGRYITLIRTSHSVDQITEQNIECLQLCAPGPHLFLLVLQSSTVKKKDRDTIKTRPDSYSLQLMKYTIVLTPHEGGSYLVFDNTQGGTSPPLHLVLGKYWRDQKRLKLLEKIEQVVRRNGEGYLTYDPSELINEDKKPPEEQGDHRLKDVEHVRLVLLGSNSSEISEVGNLILGREAFDTEAPPPSVEQHSERAGATMEGRYITLISIPHLLDPHLPQNQITALVNECMALCSPGPHVLLLVLQSGKCKQSDWEKIKTVLNLISDTALQHTMLITQKQGRGPRWEMASIRRSNVVQEIKKCVAEHYQTDTGTVGSDLVKAVDKLMKKNKKKGYLQYRVMKESPTHAKDKEKPSRDFQKKIHLIPSTAPENKASPQRLNLVLCGSNRVLKSSISDMILGQGELSPDSSSACVKMDGEVYGRLITLVELPALYSSQLSEKDVGKVATDCVSLCDPGVHAFLLVLPEGRLTAEDGEELQKIQMIFGSEFNDHTVVLITQHSQSKSLDEAVLNVIKGFGERWLFLNLHSQVQELIVHVESLLTENRGNHYTTATLVNAQFQGHLRYRRKVDGLKREMSVLGRPDLGHFQKTDSPMKTIRIILLGVTAAGKSATGNTILGREDVFQEGILGETVTTRCQKETNKMRETQIIVIDTPGLFDTDFSTDTARNEVTRAIAMVAPGPHVFLLVVPIERYNKATYKTTKMILNELGEEAKPYTMLLFTKGDNLRSNSIEQFIENSEQDTKDLIERFGDTYHVFNNSNRDDRTQVTALLGKIDLMMTKNGGSCYTNEMFQKDEREAKTMMEDQKRQQWLWYQKHVLKRDVQQDDPTGGAAYNPHQM